MTPQKRALDLILSIPAAILGLPLIGLVALILLIREGGPVLYVSERMKAPNQPFQLYKFRTMRPAQPGDGGGVTGGDKSDRMTALHRKLRKSRLDELPQLWNVIRGDMSLVGPRPPLRVYVEDHPEIYREVLKSRPGVTGLASLHFHRHEEFLLKSCETPSETDTVYRRRCIPRKARLDLIYQKHQSVCGDILLIVQTAAGVLFRRSGRP